MQMAPDAAERSGFGRQLIQKSLEMTLRAKTELIFGEDGVSCRIEMPVDPIAGSYSQV